ncbi:MAG: hypothetical protein WKF41_15365 [Gaiellaceae bacterium]
MTSPGVAVHRAPAMLRWSLATVGAVAAALVMAITVHAASSPPPYKLAKLTASLFYAESGRFSPDIPKNAPLWNTIIGEGWAKENSDATLIRVTVTGARGSYAPARAVKVSVRKGRTTSSGYAWGAVALRRSQPLGVFSGTGKTVVAAWLYDTGCVPLQVTATLVGQTPSPPLVRVIPFACGE